ncbi:ATP synthase F1 subunit delta [Clostridium sp. C105KSO13]|uniref:ATP synthase F1 subunit delta n=1 Tax=Clostridium sp. C105KSO13 TaxID=1776045 RepID=UPI0007406DA6|nr:ATP synthase F1 subunit delta [Clostridium sp. C105KSO13]CUX32233.1 ATP synthase subunit delta [Clostridium sp. C105KSO13]
MKTWTTTNHKYCPQAAVRYARVLYELNVPEEDIQKTKEIFARAPQLHDALLNPTIPEEHKRKVIDKVFPEEIRNFLKVTCRYQRINLLTDIFTAYDRYCDEQNQILKAVLTCVEPPSEVQLKQIQAFLCKKYDARRADVEIREDKELLGGFVLYVKGDEYDWSLKGRLNRLEEKLTWR